MKKFAIALFALAAAALSSCNMKAPAPSPTEPGMFIYRQTFTPHIYSGQPIDIAMRLFIWITDGKTEAEKGKLFGNATITESNGEYTISYPNDFSCPTDYIPKRGEIVVNTNSNTLSQEDEQWDIYLTGTGSENLKVNNGYIDFKECAYTLTWTGTSFSTSGSTVTMKSNNSSLNFEAVWDIDYSFYLVPGTGATLLEKYSSGKVMVMSYSSDGGIMTDYYGKYRYEWSVAESIEYRMACVTPSNPFPIANGALEASIAVCDPLFPIDENSFPSRYVELTWTNTTSACTSTQTVLKYNGFILQ